MVLINTRLLAPITIKPCRRVVTQVCKLREGLLLLTIPPCLHPPKLRQMEPCHMAWWTILTHTSARQTCQGTCLRQLNTLITTRPLTPSTILLITLLTTSREGVLTPTTCQANSTLRPTPTCTHLTSTSSITTTPNSIPKLRPITRPTVEGIILQRSGIAHNINRASRCHPTPIYLLPVLEVMVSWRRAACHQWAPRAPVVLVWFPLAP